MAEAGSENACDDQRLRLLPSARNSGLAGFQIEQLDELAYFAKFRPPLFGNRVRSLPDLEHPAATNKSQAPQQKFTLAIRQFQM
jgi:hypothetical protein